MAATTSSSAHRLIFLNHEGKPGAKFHLRDGSCVIGRNPKECDVRIQREDVDLKHCQIEFDENQVAWVTRLCGEKLVCKINGQDVTEKTKLRSGDSLQIGGRRVRYQVLAPRRPQNKTPSRTPTRPTAASSILRETPSGTEATSTARRIVPVSPALSKYREQTRQRQLQTPIKTAIVHASASTQLRQEQKAKVRAAIAQPIIEKAKEMQERGTFNHKNRLQTPMKKAIAHASSGVQSRKSNHAQIRAALAEPIAEKAQDFKDRGTFSDKQKMQTPMKKSIVSASSEIQSRKQKKLLDHAALADPIATKAKEIHERGTFAEKQKLETPVKQAIVAASSDLKARKEHKAQARAALSEPIIEKAKEIQERGTFAEKPKLETPVKQGIVEASVELQSRKQNKAQRAATLAEPIAEKAREMQERGTFSEKPKLKTPVKKGISASSNEIQKRKERKAQMHAAIAQPLVEKVQELQGRASSSQQRPKLQTPIKGAIAHASTDFQARKEHKKEVHAALAEPISEKARELQERGTFAEKPKLQTPVKQAIVHAATEATVRKEFQSQIRSTLADPIAEKAAELQSRGTFNEKPKLQTPVKKEIEATAEKAMNRKQRRAIARAALAEPVALKAKELHERGTYGDKPKMQTPVKKAIVRAANETNTRKQHHSQARAALAEPIVEKAKEIQERQAASSASIDQPAEILVVDSPISETAPAAEVIVAAEEAVPTEIIETPAPAPAETETPIVNEPSSSTAPVDEEAVVEKSEPVRGGRRTTRTTSTRTTRRSKTVVSELAEVPPSPAPVEEPPKVEEPEPVVEVPSKTVVSEDELAMKTVVQLKEELKKYGLSTSGLKAQLVTRLATHMNSL